MEDIPLREWTAWATSEERRRTIFAAYILSSLHNITFGIPPLILNREIDLRLPDFSQPVGSDPRPSFSSGGKILVVVDSSSVELLQG